jgi:hypothetical protein
VASQPVTVSESAAWRQVDWRIRYHNRVSTTARIGVRQEVPDVLLEKSKQKYPERSGIMASRALKLNPKKRGTNQPILQNGTHQKLLAKTPWPHSHTNYGSGGAVRLDQTNRIGFEQKKT